jgi:PQQ-like domain
VRWRPPAVVLGVSVAVSAAVLVALSSAAGVSDVRAAAATKGSAAPPATAGWSQVNYGPDRTGFQPDETSIGTGNVGTLTQARTYLGGVGEISAPLVANGFLYTDVAGHLSAYDATGTNGCSAAAATCAPLWTALTGNYDGMTVSDGDVFLTDAEGVQAFDAAGRTNCAGSPKVCSPLWATLTHVNSGYFTPGPGSPLVSGGVLYVPGYVDGLPLQLGGAYISAFDAAGVSHCSGAPKVCSPMWTTTGPGASSDNVGSPSVANGVLYLADGPLFAFSATGGTGCSGTPKVCAPLWTSTTMGATYSAPAVSGGTVYVGSWASGLYAFDAAGAANCSTTAGLKTCTPLWTALGLGGIGGTPAVAYGTVYTVSGDGVLYAFDAAASTNCSGPATAKTCTPVWTSGPVLGGYVTLSSPAVANGVVYFASIDDRTYAYDAAGSLSCDASATPRVCTPLWSAVTGYIGGGSPAVANGVLYINRKSSGAIYSFTGSPLQSVPTATPTPSPTPTAPPNPTPTPTPTPTPNASPTPTPTPVLTGGPLLSGTPRVGHTLTCHARYAGATSVVYHWQRNGVTVGGAAATYPLKAADRKTHLRCTSRAGNAGGLSPVSTSRNLTIGLGSPLVKHKALSIAGTAKVASTVAAKVGSWTPSATSYTYQWLLGGKAIRRATHATFTVPRGDKGKLLSVTVIAHRVGYANGSATSATVKIT